MIHDRRGLSALGVLIGLAMVLFSVVLFLGAVEALLPFGRGNIEIGSFQPPLLLGSPSTQLIASVIVAFAGLVVAIVQ